MADLSNKFRKVWFSLEISPSKSGFDQGLLIHFGLIALPQLCSSQNDSVLGEGEREREISISLYLPKTYDH